MQYPTRSYRIHYVLYTKFTTYRSARITFRLESKNSKVSQVVTFRLYHFKSQLLESHTKLLRLPGFESYPNLPLPSGCKALHFLLPWSPLTDLPNFSTKVTVSILSSAAGLVMTFPITIVRQYRQTFDYFQL